VSHVWFSGVVLPVRATGQGLLGCGKPTQDGVEQLEALRWATGVLNSGAESLIPGVKLGKYENTKTLH
jgi:hypothetical protein